MSKFLIILLLLWCKLCSLGNGLSTKRSIQPIQRRHLLLKPKNTESKSNNNSNWIAAGESSHGQEERQDVAVVTATAASHPFGNKVNEFTDFLHWDVFRYFGHEFCGRYSNKLNCYEILGFTKKDSPSTADITKNYRRLSRQWHPDKNKERISLERFVAVATAYQILSIPEKRAKYDYLLDRHCNQLEMEEHATQEECFEIEDYAPLSWEGTIATWTEIRWAYSFFIITHRWTDSLMFENAFHDIIVTMKQRNIIQKAIRLRQQKRKLFCNYRTLLNVHLLWRICLLQIELATLQFQIIYIAAGGLVVFVVLLIVLTALFYGGDIEDETLLFVDVMDHIRLRWDSWQTNLLLHQLFDAPK